jgi:hypothetical protein
VNQHQTATDTLSRHAASLRTAELPDDVAAFSRTVLTDTIGVMLAASTQPAVRIAATVMPLADPDGSTVLGRAARLPAPAAAFINGIAGHDIELDRSARLRSATNSAVWPVPCSRPLASQRCGHCWPNSAPMTPMPALFRLVGAFGR